MFVCEWPVFHLIRNKLNMDHATAYESFVLPAWAPPSWLFGPIWLILYAIIAMSFGKVIYKSLVVRELPLTIALPFFLNLVFNFAFTPIQFGLMNNYLAAADIVLVLITLIWALKVIRPHLAWVFYANIPYLLWVSFATMLQFSITYLNR